MAQENPSNPNQKESGRKWRSNTLAEYFSSRGHKVIRWRSSFSHQRKVQLAKNSIKEKHDNYYHQYIKAGSYTNHISISRILSHYDLARNFKNIAELSEKPDIVHLANVPIELSYSVAKFCFRNKIPYIVDIRDLWPDIYADLIPKRFSKLKVIANLIFKLIYDKKIYFIFKNAKSITALTESFLKWGLKKIGREKIDTDYILPMSFDAHVKNPNFKRQNNFSKKYNLKKNNIIISYVGNIGYQSEFKTIFKAAQILEKKDPNIIFSFSGTGPLLKKLEKKCSMLNNVLFTGWLDGDNLRNLLELSTLGLIIYKNDLNYVLNIPNKFPEYLSYGKPIACGTNGEMSDLVNKYNIGFTFDIENHNDFIFKLQQFLQQDKSLEIASNAAIKLHKEYFLSSVNYPKYCKFIESLLT